MVRWTWWDWSLSLGLYFLQCFDTVGWVIWPVKTRPRYDGFMTYNVFSGTLNPTQSVSANLEFRSEMWCMWYQAFSLPGPFAPWSELANRMLANLPPDPFAAWPFCFMAHSTHPQHDVVYAAACGQRWLAVGCPDLSLGSTIAWSVLCTVWALPVAWLLYFAVSETLHMHSTLCQR